ncbi:hypothetical protein TeGR_g807 [Tetraparma gracilis]|uniref:Uncharacterized protein n=1 Tax=Tetraparma gracilis TaxID=2962635 RepID=A0ABQ6MN20_9STRA|nr:hypothetical protein TeGR_g807 [Tetraparma gracilis]
MTTISQFVAFLLALATHVARQTPITVLSNVQPQSFLDTFVCTILVGYAHLHPAELVARWIRFYGFGSGQNLSRGAMRSYASDLRWTTAFAGNIRALFLNSTTMALYVTNAGAEMCPHQRKVLTWLVGFLKCIQLSVRRILTITLYILPSNYSAMLEIATDFPAQVRERIVDPDIIFESKVIVFVVQRVTGARTKFVFRSGLAAPDNANLNGNVVDLTGSDDEDV